MIPLHNHSQYSALDGFSTPEEIASRCVEIGCPCCGLTDHGVVTGHLAFAKAMYAKDIKPIFGCELYHGLDHSPQGKGRDQAHLIVLAQTDQGLKNLWSLVSATADEAHFHNVGRVFWEDLEKYKEGLIVTSACIQGLVPQGLLNDDYDPLNRYLDIFGDNFYMEISTYPSDYIELGNRLLVEAAQERGIPMVYANDAHYAFPSQFAAHDLYLALQTGDNKFTPVEDRSNYHPPGAVSMMDEAQVRENLGYFPQHIVDECIANSVAIAESITATLPKVERHLPLFVPGDCPWLEGDDLSLSPEELFVDLVSDGIVDRYGEDASDEVWDRALYEMKVLLDDGIHHYFLMGWDEVQFAKSEKFDIGPGRGSSAGCIVAYALGITDVDPLYYDLIFERFWNSGRSKGFPDIDTDFPRLQRKKTIAYLKKRHGANKVYAIGTTGYMKPKKVIDKLAKGYGITFLEAKELKAIVGQTTKIEIVGHEQVGWCREYEPGKLYYVEDDCGPELTHWVNSGGSRKPILEEFLEMCAVCCSRVAQYGIHASGIVISDVPLADYAPVYCRGPKETRQAVTMFSMKDIDSLGLIKLDLLGLRNLDALDIWLKMMSEQGVDMNWNGLDKQEHPDEMWDMLSNGYTAGVFQVESGYGRQLCKRMRPRSVEDLGVIVALNRPGPIQAKIPDQYMDRREGKEEVTYLHPALQKLQEPLLKNTYGLFVYQEQIIKFFDALGYTTNESDAVRKILGKKSRQDFADLRNGEGEWTGKGYFQLSAAKDIPQDVAETVWDIVEGFSDYSFNKSHAICYGVLTLRCAFAKYYAAPEFYAACMQSFDTDKGDRTKKAEMVPMYIDEAQRLKIDVRPPDILKSRAQSHVEDDGVWYLGFGDIKGVGSSGDYIVHLRDELGFDVSSPEVFESEFLALSDGFLADQKARKKAGEVVEKVKSPKQKLTSNKIQNLYEVGAWNELSPDGRSMDAQQEAEAELLGAVLTTNTDEIIARNREELERRSDDFAVAAEPWESDDEDLMFEEWTVGGIVSNVENKRSKQGNMFAIVTINDIDSDNQIEFTVFGNKLKGAKFLLKPRTVGIFKVRQFPPNNFGENYTFESGIKLK